MKIINNSYQSFPPLGVALTQTEGFLKEFNLSASYVITGIDYIECDGFNKTLATCRRWNEECQSDGFALRSESGLYCVFRRGLSIWKEVREVK